MSIAGYVDHRCRAPPVLLRDIVEYTRCSNFFFSPSRREAYDIFPFFFLVQKIWHSLLLFVSEFVSPSISEGSVQLQTNQFVKNLIFRLREIKLRLHLEEGCNVRVSVVIKNEWIIIDRVWLVNWFKLVVVNNI